MKLPLLALVFLLSADFALAALGCGNPNQGKDCPPKEGNSPVVVFSGDVKRSIKDLEVWGGVGEHQLTWNRTGRSRFVYGSAFGYGHTWRHGYEYSMADYGTNQSGQSVVVVTFPDGHANKLTKINSTTWMGTAAVGNRITETGSEFMLQEADGYRYRFVKLTDGGWTRYQMQKIIDPSGHEYVLSYNSGNQFTQVTEPGGRYLQVTRSSIPMTYSWIGSAENAAPLGATVAPSSGQWVDLTVTNTTPVRYVRYYGPWNKYGQIAEMEIYEAGTNTLLTGTAIGGASVDSAHAFAKATDGDPSTYFKSSDPVYGFSGLDLGSAKVIGKIRYKAPVGLESTMAGGAFQGFAHQPNAISCITQVTTSDGRSVQYQYTDFTDSELAFTIPTMTKAIYGDSTEATYAYAQEYKGLMPTLVYADDPRYPGKGRTEKYEYNLTETGVAGFLKKEINGVTDAVTLTIAEGNGAGVIGVTASNGGTRNYKMPNAQLGNLDKTTDALGRITQYTYDMSGTGFVTQVTDPLSHSKFYTRTSFGNPLTITHPDSTVETWTRSALDSPLTYTDRLGRVTTWIRDSLNRVTRIDYADSSYEIFAYSTPLGQVTSHRLRNGGTETYAYDSTGLMTTYTDPLNNDTTYTYDSHGRLETKTDARSHTTTYEYDERGLLTKVINPDSSYRTMTYDDYGDRLTVTNEIGKTWTYTYDEFKRRTSVTDPLSRATLYNYGIGSTMCQSCHSDDFITQITLPSGKITKINYDVEWQKTSEVVGYGTAEAATTQFTYDNAGNLLTQTDPRSQVTTLTYNVNNRCLTSTDPLSHTTEWTYDAEGNVLTIERPDNGVTTNVYDDMNRLEQSTDPKSQVTQYTYDAAGNLLTMTDAKSQVHTYTYDLMNRKLSLTYPNSTAESWTYDEMGNVATYTTRAGQVRTCTYDNRDRETLCDWSDSTPDVNRTYDTAGRLLTLTNSNSAITYTYNDANELLSESFALTGLSSTLAVSYTYTTDGQPATVTYPSGKVVTYTYTNRNQVHTIASNLVSGNLTTYTYDVAGRRTQRGVSNGTATTYAYDNANRMTQVKQLNEPGIFAQQDYAYDTVNRRTSTTYETGKIDEYTYDAVDQVTNVKYEKPSPSGTPAAETSYVHDAVGNRSSITINGTLMNYTANSVNQYTAEGANGLTYDTNGNLITRIGWTYTYDAQNRLIGATDSVITASLAYDALNRVVKRTISGTSTYYVYEGWKLIGEYSSSAVLQAGYVHGVRADEPLLRVGSTTSYYQQDVLGNVTHLTDAFGAVQEKYKYDIYGKPTLLDASGSVLTATAFGNRFLFTGREWLAELGLYDYRNRVYSPELGRFLQTDPIRFAGGDINVYRYVGNNAMNRIDPMGLLSGLMQDLLTPLPTDNPCFDPFPDPNPNPPPPAPPDSGPRDRGPGPNPGSGGGGNKSPGSGAPGSTAKPLDTKNIDHFVLQQMMGDYMNNFQNAAIVIQATETGVFDPEIASGPVFEAGYASTIGVAIGSAIGVLVTGGLLMWGY
jgi:RHS repeat-associated protein